MHPYKAARCLSFWENKFRIALLRHKKTLQKLLSEVHSSDVSLQSFNNIQSLGKVNGDNLKPSSCASAAKDGGELRSLSGSEEFPELEE